MKKGRTYPDSGFREEGKSKAMIDCWMESSRVIGLPFGPVFFIWPRIEEGIHCQRQHRRIKLANRQAAVEKLQWEARTSNQKVEQLQEELDSMRSQISSLMHIFEGLSQESDDAVTFDEDYDITPYYADYLSDLDDMDENHMQKMEEARESYIAAVAMAKEKQDEESLAAAAKARLHLQSFVFTTKNSDL
ncbi:unnamed protein product [Amaranthus hypochondriacus]